MHGSRRSFLRQSAASAAALIPLSGARGADRDGAQIAITFDLEMSRNFPRWEDTHWDYEKGNLDKAAKDYTLEAARRVRARGGVIHCFCVGQVLEQEDVSWLKQLAETGHPIGNHTYDHVNLLAADKAGLQYRFRRAPWLIDGKTSMDVIAENIRMTTQAMKQRLGIKDRGFRTPGGFSDGLKGRQDLQKLLLECGFRWVSSLYPRHLKSRPRQQPSDAVYHSILAAQAAAQPFVYPTGLIEIPMSPISDIGAFRSGRWDLNWFLESVRQSVEWAIEHRKVFDFLCHPSCLGIVDPEFRTIDLICELVEQSGGRATIVDLDSVAARFAAI